MEDCPGEQAPLDRPAGAGGAGRCNAVCDDRNVEEMHSGGKYTPRYEEVKNLNRV